MNEDTDREDDAMLTRTDGFQVELLDIVCNPETEIPFSHRLAVLIYPNCADIPVHTSVAGKKVANARVGSFAGDPNRALIAIPDVISRQKATVTLDGVGAATVETGPVHGFDIMLMPTSHLCFGYNSGLPEHIEAGRVVSGAVQMLTEHPEYRWNIEFVRGAHKLLMAYPHLAEQARALYQQGRLGVGSMWTSSFFENFDAEAEVRQLAEAQWWLRDNFGATSPVMMATDSSGFDPQQPQVLKQSGIDFFWHCRYTLNDKESGSPFLEHVGTDGTRLPCFTSRKPLASGYTWVPIKELLHPELLAGQEVKADRSNADRFADLALEIHNHLRACREICDEDFSVHFSGSDQSHAYPFEATQVAAWNAVFRIPTVSFASIGEASSRLANSQRFKRDVQEPEQPHWGPVNIAGFRLTLLFQEASYALCTAEKASAIDLLANGAPYPADEMHAAWMNILDEQHHEQLGYGSGDLVEHARDGLRRSLATARNITTSAAMRTASKISFSKSEPAVTVFNYLNWPRRDTVETQAFGGNAVVMDPSGRGIPHEVTKHGTLRFRADVEGMGYSTYYVANSESPVLPADDLNAEPAAIENDCYRVEVDPATGCITKIFDKKLQTTISDASGDRLPFELVVNEDSGNGYCAFWPTGRLWRASEIPNASVKTEATGLAARIVVERPLLAPEGEAKFGSRLRIEYELPTRTNRLDVSITVDWDSEPKRELRLFVPLAMKSPRISYDTLFATVDYDPELPGRQGLYIPELDKNQFKSKALFDHRQVARFVSAHDETEDVCVTMTAPHGLLRVEHGGISFSLIEDRTDCYWNGMLAEMKGRHTFHTSLTSHRGDWKSARDWRFGWEHRGRFNGMIAVVPERLYPVLPEKGRMTEVDGENLVLTAMKISHKGEDLVARVYDGSGGGDRFGFRLVAPYAGVVPYRWVYFQTATGQKGAGYGTDVAGSKGLSCSDRYSLLTPLSILEAWNANLLEDPQERIALDDLQSGQVRIKPHGIFTARLGFEVLNHDSETIKG